MPTHSSSLCLSDVHVCPSLIKNLLSVRKLTRDNNVSVEFDPFGFLIKDLRSRHFFSAVIAVAISTHCRALRRLPVHSIRPSTYGMLVSDTLDARLFPAC